MASRGRPRRFDAADEERLLFDAALEVMARNGYQHATVADILAAAGLSTRSFYRHFASKDELVCAMFRREAEAAGERLERRVAATDSPRAALEAWIDEILSFRASKAKAKRVTVLGSSAVTRAEGYDDEVRHAAKLLAAPLESIVAEGVRDGSFPTGDAEHDARMIQAVVWAAAGLVPNRSTSSMTGAGLRDQVLSFCLRALGAA